MSLLGMRSRWLDLDEPVDWEDIDPSGEAVVDVPVVYLVFNPTTQLVKIGNTANLPQRLRQLGYDTKAAIELLSYRKAKGHSFARRRADAHDVERDLHHLFRQHWVHSEWFRPALEIYEAFGVWDELMASA